MAVFCTNVSTAKNRQVKKDVLEKAVEMYPDIICLSKQRSGNKNVRIVYKPKINISSLKRKLSVI